MTPACTRCGSATGARLVEMLVPLFGHEQEDWQVFLCKPCRRGLLEFLAGCPTPGTTRAGYAVEEKPREEGECSDSESG